MLSAICFNLDQSKILSSGNGLSAFYNHSCLCSKCRIKIRFTDNLCLILQDFLYMEVPQILYNSTLYNTIPTFQHLWKKQLLKTLWEKEKMLVTSIFFFSRNVFYSFQPKFQFLSHDYFVHMQML